MSRYCLLFLLASLVQGADPVPIKFRVTGLFSPDRVEDLREVMKKMTDVTLVSVDYKTSEASFLFDAIKLLNKPRPEQVVERFDMLLRQNSFATFGIREVGAIPQDQLTLIVIPVYGLDCKGCCLATYEAIYKIDGVEKATASYKEGVVTALIDPAKTNRAALEEALKKKMVMFKAP